MVLSATLNGFRFRRGREVFFPSFLFFAIGVFLFGFGAFTRSVRDSSQWIFSLLGAIFVTCALFIFFRRSTAYRFDRSERCAWSDKRSLRAVGDPEMLEGYLPFSEIKCLQLYSEIRKGAKNSTHVVYVLNLVKKDGERITLSSGLSTHRSIANAKTLAAFLEVPLLTRWKASL